MSDILVVGGGFAGVWSAVGAAKVLREAGSRHSVTLVAPNEDMVIRPRLYEANPERMCVPLDRVLGPVGVQRVRGTVVGIDTAQRNVTASTPDGGTITLPYRRLVLAAGSQLIQPTLPGSEHLHNIDTLDAAAALDAHLRRLPDQPAVPGRFTAIVVGAGFTGLEIATELVGRLRAIVASHGASDEVRVVLVERADVVGPDLGPGPRPAIEQALAELEVEVRLNATLESLDAEGVTFSDGARLLALTVVWTAGMHASPLTAEVPASRDRLGRLEVGPWLEVSGVPGIYAAGDTANAVAEPGHHVMQSCQHASPMGRTAGHNAAADLLGLAPVPFAPDPYVTCLALGSAGAVLTSGWERTVQATGEKAKQQKRTINEVWIYPPVDDADEILHRAATTTSRRIS